MISAFGVEHGDTFSKARPSKHDKGDYNGHPAPSTGRRALAGVFPTEHGLIAGKRGKKIRSGANEGGGAILGSLAGASFGAATRSPELTSIGSLGGGIAGAQLGLNRNTRKGYMKREQ